MQVLFSAITVINMHKFLVNIKLRYVEKSARFISDAS